MTVRLSLQRRHQARSPKPPETSSPRPPSAEPVHLKSPSRPMPLSNPPALPHVKRDVLDGSGRVRCVFIYPGDRLLHAISHSPRAVHDLVELSCRPVDIVCEFGSVSRRKLPAYYYANDKQRPSTCSTDSRRSVCSVRSEGRRQSREPPARASKSARPAYGNRLRPQSVTPVEVISKPHRVPTAEQPTLPPTPIDTEKRGSLLPGVELATFLLNRRRRSSVPALYVTDTSSESIPVTTRRHPRH